MPIGRLVVHTQGQGELKGRKVREYDQNILCTYIKYSSNKNCIKNIKKETAELVFGESLRQWTSQASFCCGFCVTNFYLCETRSPTPAVCLELLSLLPLSQISLC